ncbi:unannotated protein [freshwater metagenome]|uniref:Unannotated protein n=1 Tax=freshwater metagenome TaxID=449393 RepID=A0A6J6EIZ9_9ZZZZ
MLGYGSPRCDLCHGCVFKNLYAESLTCRCQAARQLSRLNARRVRVPDRAGGSGDGNAIHRLLARKQLRIGHGPRCFIGGPRFESLLLRWVHGDVVFATLHDVGVNRLSSTHGNDLIDRFVDPALPIPYEISTKLDDKMPATTRDAVGQPTAIATGCPIP